MFSLVCALPSPASAEACASLFDWFTGTTAQSHFSGTCMSAVWFMAFADRSCSFEEDVREISRFSCWLFLSGSGSQTTQDRTATREIAWLPCCLPPSRKGVGILIHRLFEAQSPGPLVPLVYASR